MTGESTKILFVDDEPNVLSAMRRQLRGKYDVVTMGSGADGLAALHDQGPFAVVVSDMQMPEMNGAVFLSSVRAQSPDTVRILLTGHADLNSAIQAVNEGQIFRFLCKPCPPETLMSVLDLALEQYRLVTSERVLLEQTLRGSVQALTDILALANPLAFGRASRLKQYAGRVAGEMDLADQWPIEVAAMLSQAGCVTLADETVQKLYHGRQLSGSEVEQVSRLPETVDRFLKNIPRLEPVRAIILAQMRPLESADASPAYSETVKQGAQILRVVDRFDRLVSGGAPMQDAIATLRTEKDLAVEVIDALSRAHAKDSDEREITLSALHVGMVLAQDLVNSNGALLVARGQEISDGMLDRILQLSKRVSIREPVKVLVPVDDKFAAHVSIEANCKA